MGLRIGKINGRSLQPALRDGTFAVFRSAKRVKRGDVVLVYHPEFGKLVREVGAITVNDRVSLLGMSRLIAGNGGESAVEHASVYGKILFRIPLLRWRQARPRRGAAGPVD